ncbi:MAG: 23S rRNA (guanosine(2251)-2'-O)-methyltransferase RlmB, partial [bacterium]|nr:23S rRNA (guanosine(2251)-2'-O)-methyltransferase RlmB [bacterium]
RRHESRQESRHEGHFKGQDKSREQGRDKSHWERDRRGREPNKVDAPSWRVDGSDTASADELATVYGRHSAEAVLIHRIKSVREGMLLEGAKFSESLQAGLDELRQRGVRLLELPRSEIDARCEKIFPEAHINHQGIVLRCLPQEPLSLEVLARRALADSGIIVVLDQVTDPHNLGAVLRAGAAFGISGVVLTKDRSAQMSGVARKASAGAAEIVPYAVVTNLARALKDLKEAGFWVVGTSLAEKAESLEKFTLRPPFVLVLGSEGHGMRRQTEELCDYLLQIPMIGNMESLNVSQAAAVLLYQLQVVASRGA